MSWFETFAASWKLFSICLGALGSLGWLGRRRLSGCWQWAIRQRSLNEINTRLEKRLIDCQTEVADIRLQLTNARMDNRALMDGTRRFGSALEATLERLEADQAGRSEPSSSGSPISLPASTESPPKSPLDLP